MKKYYFLIIVVLILGLVLTGCLLSNVGQVPPSEQSGITYLTKGLPFVPVGLWHLDEGSGVDTVADSSGNGNTGTVVGATTGVAGKFGDALSFDGVDDYVDCGNDASLDITTAITIEAWVYPRSAGRNNYGRITDKHPAPCLLVGPNGQLRWFGDIGGISVDKAVCTDCVSWNSWHHLALTYDMNESTPTIRGYVDGELKGTITGYSGPLSTTSVYLAIGNSLEEGTEYYLNRAFDGLIDEVHIWNRALTGEEIADNYKNLYMDVTIDIKPGSDTNSINLGSNGVVPVAILSSSGFDAATVNPSTVTLSGAGVKRKGNSGSLEDVNGDGFLDLVVQVCTDDFALTAGATEAVLNAYTYTGLPFFTGSDVIRIVPPK